MQNKFKISIALAGVLLLAAACNSAAQQPSAQPTAATNQTTSTKLTDQEYYKYTYLISGDTLSPEATKALTGFNMTKNTLADGTTQITLKALKTGYQDQQYILKTGEQLYFIERMLGDDRSEANEDQSMKDDSAVIVDSSGNVIGEPSVWITSK